jgi:hypothetical protein
MRWGYTIVRARWPWRLEVREGRLDISLPWWGGPIVWLARQLGFQQILIVGRIESADGNLR